MSKESYFKKAYKALWQAKKRAKFCNVIYFLGVEEARNKLVDQDYKCALTGIPFRDEGFGPYSMSLDRINPDDGYVIENIRWILTAVNAMKGVGTDYDVYHISEALLERRDTRTGLPSTRTRPGH